MAGLRGKEWFYKQCLREIKGFGPFTHLCWDILEKGIGQKDKTRGHVTHSIGAVQNFLGEHEGFCGDIRDSDPTKPFEISEQPEILDAWRRWFATKNGQYGHPKFGYNYDTLRGYLTPTLGGIRRGGGGGDDEFKRVLRLMPEFLGSP